MENNELVYLIMKNYLNTNLISKLKLINILLIIFGYNLFDFKSFAHFRGYYSTQIEAKEKSRELGCIGTFKLKKMWMPCGSEKELHKYLRKNK